MQAQVEAGGTAGRVLAHVFGGALDESLAAGGAPESSPLLAARARAIVALPHRTALADSWERMLLAARGLPALRVKVSAAVPVPADRIVASSPAIRELVRCLAAPLPVPVRGVAMATVLLTDASGPVFNGRSDVSLADALDAAITQLDPSLPLM
ncbi:MAG: hypothetical protein ACRDN0_07400 [Trebonia sp.]